MIDLTTLLSIKYSNEEWSLTNNDYNTLIWKGPGDKPTLEELQNAHDELVQILAARKVWNSRVEFWNAFTMQEKIAIATSTNDMVKFFFAELTIWNGEVWSDDPRVQQGLDLLVAEQIITPQRRADILAKSLV